MKTLINGSKIGNATVIVDIIPAGNPNIRPARKMTPRYITDHDTGNAGRGANAEMHNRYIHNMARLSPRDTSHVSWHLTVDEHFIYQHIPFDENAWHCGDGLGAGNLESIGIEKCMHAGADREAIEANSIALTAYLMKAFNVPIANVRPHQSWSGKYCPAVILKKYGSFAPYRAKIEAAFKGGAPTVKPVSNATLHVVARGETLSGIAAKYGSSVEAFASANTIKNANMIYVGQRLVVPGKAASAPKPSVVAKPKPAAKPKEYVVLPANARTWRTYKLTVKPVAANSDWSLTPAAFGGLEYEVLARPYPDVVTIQTSRGRRNIYVAQSTGAKFKRK